MWLILSLFFILLNIYLENMQQSYTFAPQIQDNDETFMYI